MTASVVNPVITMTSFVFRRMLNAGIQRKLLALLEDVDYFSLTALISLKGRISGQVCLSFPDETAIRVYEGMADEVVGALTPDVKDALCELCNIVVGRIRPTLPARGLSMGLPALVVGTDYRLEFPTGAFPMAALFDSEVGPFLLAFGFSEAGRRPSRFPDLDVPTPTGFQSSAHRMN